MDRIIYLVRHGITRSNIEKVYAGWSHEGLIEEGIIQANSLGDAMKNHGIKVVYTSPIKRAVQTAEIINRYIEAPLITESDFTEIKMGPWEGLSEEQVNLKYPKEFKIWQSRPSKLNLEERETLQEIQCRALKGIGKILGKHSQGITLVVTHVAVIRCLLLFFNNANLDMYKKIDIPNLSIHQLLFQGKKATAKRVKVTTETT